jgi:hypothetical protein
MISGEVIDAVIASDVVGKGEEEVLRGCSEE